MVTLSESFIFYADWSTCVRQEEKVFGIGDFYTDMQDGPVASIHRLRRAKTRAWPLARHFVLVGRLRGIR
jgi:hypothetical protein